MDPDPYKTMTDPDPVDPKTYGSRSQHCHLMEVKTKKRLVVRERASILLVSDSFILTPVRYWTLGVKAGVGGIVV
jgi:hypothetical protein